MRRAKLFLTLSTPLIYTALLLVLYLEWSIPQSVVVVAQSVGDVNDAEGNRAPLIQDVNNHDTVKSTSEQQQIMKEAPNDKTSIDDNEEEDGEDHATCSLNNPSQQSNNDCSIPPSSSDTTTTNEDSSMQQDLTTRQIITLTDDNFDRLTMTSFPSTWLIMFKTESCAICKKSKPIFENLVMDPQIVGFNVGELLERGGSAGSAGRGGGVGDSAEGSEEEKKITNHAQSNSNNVKDDTAEAITTPKGPIYIATIDAGWSGRDTTLRFQVDATPTIIVLRNDGYGYYDTSSSSKTNNDNSNNNNNNDNTSMDSRSYYIYHGQRAMYPLRNFILGGFQMRKRYDMPPLLQEEERKPRGILGRIYEYISPNIIKMGGWVLKFMGVWYLFLGVLGLFMRIHNYAWGDDDDDDYDEKDGKEEVIRGDAKGYPIDMDEKTAQRQKLMWERKAQNHAKFAANREAKKKKKAGGSNGNGNGEKKTSDGNRGGGDDDDDDNFEGIGRSVKRSEARQAKVDAGKASKSKTNAQRAKAEARKDSTSKKN